MLRWIPAFATDDPDRPESKSVIFLLLLVLLNTLILAPLDVMQAAEPPFDVRRSTDLAQVRSAPVQATTSVSPYDDEPGILDDGTPYFYVIEDSSGQPVALSVDKNAALGTIRLGFDDGDPVSADVDSAQSTVEVLPGSIPADGVSVATIVIVPRDSSGVSLGAGLAVTMDVSALAPGIPSSGVVDQSNGSYTVSVISWAEGFGTAMVTVEGLILVDAPDLTYEFAELAGLPSDLLQIADELQDIADVSSSSVSNELEKALQDILKAVGELAKTPANFEKAIFRIAKAFEDLQKAEDEGMSSSLAEVYRERLAEIARRIAVDAINEAFVAGGNPDKIEDATANLADGDDKLAAQDYKGAVDKYQDAAKEARL